jgi:hypothetical protein
VLEYRLSVNSGGSVMCDVAIDGTKEQVIKSYEVFFETVISLVRKYDTRVEIGLQLHNGFEYNNKSKTGYPIRLDDSGLIVWHDHIPRKSSVGEVIDHLYRPNKILENMMLALIQAAEKNKEKVNELLFALRFARALSKEDEIHL